MSRSQNRGLFGSLSAGLSIIAIFAVTLPLNAQIENVSANERSTDGLLGPRIESLENLKDLSDPEEEINSKGINEDLDVPGPFDTIAAPFEFDLNKTTGPGSFAAEGKSDALDFVATAYCLTGRTASGEFTRPGIVAADPRVLPLGTIVHIRAGHYTGTYTVLDTGALIKGRKVDIYIPSYQEAIKFGRRPIKLRVLWKPTRQEAIARSDSTAAAR